MLPNKEGQKVPEVTFKLRKDNQWVNLSSKEIFDNKKVVVFSLPGAFTPTCSSTHLPRYSELSKVFRKEGIDSIICLSVNDAFVMNEWAKSQNSEGVELIPDGNGEFSEKMGMLVDKSSLGFGKRSWRYSMYVENGEIKKMFIEPEKEGDPFEVSDAETMLHYLAPKAQTPKRISLFTKPGCPYCARAKELLKAQGHDYEEIVVGQNGVSLKSLMAVTGKSSVPQVYIEGKHIGGSEELEKYLLSKDGSAA